MPAPIFVEHSGLSGLGSAPTAPWARQPTTQSDPGFAARTKTPVLIGVGAMAAGVLAFAMGQKALGAVLGLGGVGAVVYGTIATKAGSSPSTGFTMPSMFAPSNSGITSAEWAAMNARNTAALNTAQQDNTFLNTTPNPADQIRRDVGIDDRQMYA